MKAKHNFFILMTVLGALNRLKAQDTVTMNLKDCRHLFSVSTFCRQYKSVSY